MTLQKSGTRVEYTITYLEMAARPDWAWPPMPATSAATLLKAENPPIWWFLALYDAVGRDYAWEDAHTREYDDLTAWLQSDRSALYTLFESGWPQGFFMLDFSRGAEVELAYFGLVREAIGKGLGSWMLKTAILTAWDHPGIETLTVNTCTLDHPRALQGYQKHGFVPVRREDSSRILTRDRDLSRIPA